MPVFSMAPRTGPGLLFVGHLDRSRNVKTSRNWLRHLLLGLVGEIAIPLAVIDPSHRASKDWYPFKRVPFERFPADSGL